MEIVGTGLIISLIILIIGIVLLCKAHSIKFQKDKEKEEYIAQLNKTITDLDIISESRQQHYNTLLNQISQKQKEFDEADKKADDERKKAETAYQERKAELDQQNELYQQVLDNSSSNYLLALEKAYEEAEQQHDNFILDCAKKEEELFQRIQDYRSQIKDLRQTLAAGVEAQLKEREREEKKDFYRVNLSLTDAQDVVRLEALKPSLNKPDILSKLIWSTYFQKQTTEMCNRILGTKDVVCGIYKITNLITKQMYIGQSVDIATRWKTHMKCGLGIDAPSTNKLYKAMQEDGIVNFTFEVLEQCSRDQLNEKEAFWIETYSADKIGYNSTKGNTSRAAT